MLILPKGVRGQGRTPANDRLRIAIVGVVFLPRVLRVSLIAPMPTMAVVGAASGVMSHQGFRKIVLDPAGFDFGNVTSFRDLNFVPGGVKYGGLPALIKLCAPAEVMIVSGASGASAAFMR